MAEEWRYLEVKEKEVVRCNSIHSTLVDGMVVGLSPNTVFLEECPGYVLSLGRNQCCEEECDIAECERLGIDLNLVTNEDFLLKLKGDR